MYLGARGDERAREGTRGGRVEVVAALQEVLVAAHHGERMHEDEAPSRALIDDRKPIEGLKITNNVDFAKKGKKGRATCTLPA